MDLSLDLRIIRGRRFHRHFHNRFVSFRHWNYLLRLIYSTENTSVLSRARRGNARKNRVCI
jgi:hypothetical protein